ncbi:sporulation protein SPS19 [Phyllosticta citrichinensis]|uniref:2,4-dienoyl-CoA reductase [(3E)-enoyl-CoA-producing] n=1 Tax=Phyllosticta citrichinensis TaxID=1130410 RepID=A0ABR1XNT5_9PEZI
MPLPKSEYVSDVWRDGIFANKVVFCTGGAGTICSAQVRALVHLGADACIIGRQVEKTERVAADIATARPGARVLGFGNVDVRNPESLQDAADRCAKELGSIDFVIAGAAGNFLSSMNNLSTNAFKAVMDIDVLGSYNTVKATLPYLVESAAKHKTDGINPPLRGTGGRIIFVSATIHYTGMPLQTHVMVAKAGVDQLAHSVCIEQGPRGITSNVIAPGPIRGTEGMERLSTMANNADPSAAGRGLPSGRWGTVKEIADATVYLFSDAGNYVNGEILVVDGGAWHVPSTGPGAEFTYPDFLLNNDEIKGVKGGKKAKL